jgi:NTE family protein
MHALPHLFLGFIFFILSSSAAAQHFSNLVLEGAGVRGIAYVGAIKYLEERGMVNTIDKVAGTSAGAIAALAIALGYNSKEIEDLIYKTKLQKFNDGQFFFIGGFTRLNRNYGWYRGKAFTRWLEEIIESKTGDSEITFRQLHDRNFKDLYVTGTSLNHQRLIVFSYQSYPAMKVKDAIRISMSIPLYFEAVIIDSSGHVMSRKQATSYHDLVVDGGFTGNFPITIFDSTTVDRGVSKRAINRATIGIRIDTPEQIKYDSLGNGLAPIPIHRFRNYMAAFYNFVIENLNRVPLVGQDWERTVSISSGDIGPKIRRLSVQEKNLLIDNGYAAMAEFCAGLK